MQGFAEELPLYGVGSTEAEAVAMFNRELDFLDASGSEYWLLLKERLEGQ